MARTVMSTGRLFFSGSGFSLDLDLVFRTSGLRVLDLFRLSVSVLDAEDERRDLDRRLRLRRPLLCRPRLLLESEELLGE